ncbi:MAG TPA: OmpA family protein [Burkholderiales bacterium]|nr:OmpA family protein [Burkholderiales bacterium]
MRKQPSMNPWSRTAVAISLALVAGGAWAAAPGYVTSGADSVPVTDASGNCWTTGAWTPANAAAPCHAVARAAAAPVPPPVTQAPAPAPVAPIVQAPAPVIQRINLSTDVLFEFNKAQLRPGAHEKLDELAQTMQGAEVDRVVVVGHADRIASEDYNRDLSERRAQAVKEYLTQKGVAPDRVQTEGKGESEPVAQCGKMGPERGSNQKLVSCLQPDRRVEIEVLGHREVAATGSEPSGTGSGAGTGSGSGSGTASGGASGTR